MDISSTTQISLDEVKSRIKGALYDPTSLVKAVLEVYSDVSDGATGVVDPTNPFVMLSEMSAVSTSVAVQEAVALHRRTYPALAQSVEDLYTHMSDEDYLNRFATPAYNKFFITLETNGLLNNMVRDDAEKCYKSIIPRDTTIEVDGYVFTLLYPIIIRNYDNGSVDIIYDTDKKNPLMMPDTSVIDYTERQSSDGVKVVWLEVRIPQVKIDSTTKAADKSTVFMNKIDFKDSFCFARAFYRNDSSSSWTEMLTTHTDQVFDSTKPTMLLKVGNGELTTFIPPIYLTKNMVGGEIRVDIYTTKGAIAFAANKYPSSAFTVIMKPIDEVADSSVYTNALSQVSISAGCTDMVTGGSNEISFDELRSRVIYNAIGPQNIPITMAGLEVDAAINGFTIVGQIDVLTNRVFLATRMLSTPANKKIITPANIGMVTYLLNLQDLSRYSNIKNNGSRSTILSDTLYINENGQVRMLTSTEIAELKMMNQTSMVAKINASQYLYTPFYYVLDDSTNEFDLRAYALDLPIAGNRNFVRQNQTLQLAVNVGSYEFIKMDFGYRLRVVTKSGNFYKNLMINEAGIQLAFYPEGETTLAYINGVLESFTEENERVYLFDIETNYDVDEEDRLCITNAEVDGVTDYKAWVNLKKDIHLLHWTTSIATDYRADETDKLIGKFLISGNAVGNVHDMITLTFGYSLSNLWRRCRSYSSGLTYKRYTTNIELTYTSDIYETDPATGSIITVTQDGKVAYNLMHKKGDTVLDAEGNPVYKHRIGDVVLDADGNPVVEGSSTSNKEIDILVVDGRYHFANEIIAAGYRDEITSEITDWITDGLTVIEDKLLDETNIYFYPKTTLGTVRVNTENNGQDYLTAEQAFTLDLLVEKSVHDDPVTKETLRTAAIKLLDQYIGKRVVNMTEISEKLRTLFGSTVKAFRLSGLGGSKDYNLVTVASEQNKLCLKKELVILADGSMTVQDAVSVNFNLASS